MKVYEKQAVVMNCPQKITREGDYLVFEDDNGDRVQINLTNETGEFVFISGDRVPETVETKLETMFKTCRC